MLLFPCLFGIIAYLLVGFNPLWECFGVFLCTLITFAAGRSDRSLLVLQTIPGGEWIMFTTLSL